MLLLTTYWWLLKYNIMNDMNSICSTCASFRWKTVLLVVVMCPFLILSIRASSFSFILWSKLSDFVLFFLVHFVIFFEWICMSRMFGHFPIALSFLNQPSLMKSPSKYLMGKSKRAREAHQRLLATIVRKKIKTYCNSNPPRYCYGSYWVPE